MPRYPLPPPPTCLGVAFHLVLTSPLFLKPCPHPPCFSLYLQIGGLGTFDDGCVLFLKISDLPSADAVAQLQVKRGGEGLAACRCVRGGGEGGERHCYSIVDFIIHNFKFLLLHMLHTTVGVHLLLILLPNPPLLQIFLTLPCLKEAVKSHFGSQLPGCVHVERGGRFHAHVTVAKPPRAVSGDGGGGGGGSRGASRGRQGPWLAAAAGGRGGGGGRFEPCAPLKAACAQLLPPAVRTMAAAEEGRDFGLQQQQGGRRADGRTLAAAELMASCQIKVKTGRSPERPS